MLEIAIYLVVLIILIFALVKLIDKFVTPGNKKVFIDPSIAVAALNANPKSMENDLETFGFIFENLCIRDLSVYTNSHGGKVSYYHDKSDCNIQISNYIYFLIFNSSKKFNYNYKRNFVS